MTTTSYSSFLDQTTNAGYRAWIAEFHTALVAVGMVQTADAGQVNTATITVPGAGSTYNGYSLWHFVGSVLTLYLRFDFGSGALASWPSMMVTVGTGSDGAGGITGQSSTPAIFTNNNPPNSTITNYTSRMCHRPNAFSFSWKEASMGGGSGEHAGFLVVGTACDGSGAALSDGFGVLRMDVAASFSLSFQSIRSTASGAAAVETFIDTYRTIYIPGIPAVNSVASTGNTQIYLIELNYPDVIPWAWAGHVFITEAARGSTLLVALVGSATHTYVSVGNMSNNPYGATNRSGVYCPAMVYE